MSTAISKVSAHDARFTLKPGEGADAVHSNPQYAYAVTLVRGDDGTVGTGFVLTLGQGNQLVTTAIELLAESLVGLDIEELMSRFGEFQCGLANHPQLRWLGPHKGVVHLALASLTNACFDLWAKSRGVPLWSLLLSLTPEELVNLLDLSYLEDVLTRDQAIDLITSSEPTRSDRSDVIKTGYPGYDTSIGWFGYSDDRLIANAKAAVDESFDALKLKVGSADPAHDIRRAHLLREAVGPDVRLMVDANQQWSVPASIAICQELAPLDLFWVEEPTHPDDILGHMKIAEAIRPTRIATGEHVANRIGFKNYIEAGAMHFVQADCTRLAGVSEFLTVSLLARQANLPVAPHVGDMGQVHQHLMIFLRVALDNDLIFLEHIPHLREHFTRPAQIRHAHYVTPEEPGSSADLVRFMAS